VIIATDGMEGLKRLEEGGYDLVITDIVMHGKEPEAAAVEKKADIVLAKPVRMSTLMALMDELLQPDAK